MRAMQCAVQMAMEQKVKLADVVIDNNGSEEDLESQVRNVLGSNKHLLYGPTCVWLT